MMKETLLLACILCCHAPIKAYGFGTLSNSLLVTRSSLSRVRSATRIYAEGDEVAVTPDDFQRFLTTDDDADDESKSDDGVDQRAVDLKRKLYQLAASYDRGFGATPKARKEADDIIEQLSTLNPTKDCARGIDGDSDDVPLKAIWRMVWTSAFDVVSLGASPFAAPSAIYQDIRNPPVAINIIDFIPRAQTFFPASISPPSLLRAEVTTRAKSRNGKPDRVGLLFEGLKLQPIELLGQKVDNLPPLSIDFTWQQTLVEKLADLVPGVESLVTGDESNFDADAPGYFNVEYVDDELLIIQQQAPGGVFALVKVESCEP